MSLQNMFFTVTSFQGGHTVLRIVCLHFNVTCSFIDDFYALKTIYPGELELTMVQTLLSLACHTKNFEFIQSLYGRMNCFKLVSYC